MAARPIIQMVRKEGVIDLAWGHPDPRLLPVAAMRRATEAALDRYGDEALQYGHPAGPGPLLEWLQARIAEREGREPGPDELLVTGGISHGLDLLLSWISAPGDTVLVETPTYHLATRIMGDRGLKLVPAPTDKDGVRVEVLAETTARLRQAGRPARALYLVPTFNNPTGVSLSGERRAALLQLAEAENLLIIEDDVYRELAYDGPAPPSLWSMDTGGRVARLGSFAKTLAPGLRLGWLTGPGDLVRRMVEGGLLDSGGGTNHFTALAVATLCAAGDFEAQVAVLRAAYAERREALVTALREHLPGCRVRRPGGGFFVWVELPEAGPGAKALAGRAEATGVGYLPGERFHLDGGGKHCLRLAFSLYGPSELAEGARRLGRAVGANVSG